MKGDNEMAEKSKTKTAKMLEGLEKKIEQVQSSEEFKELLETFSKFHDYSFHNTILIQMQCPGATHVAGYKQWQKKFNRHVKKGEKGIAILAPRSFKKKVVEEVEKNGKTIEEEKEKEIMYFRPVYVFDVSQTEGEPLPSIDLEVEDVKGELREILERYARTKELSIEYKDLPKGREGSVNLDKIITVNDNFNNTKKASVLAHEIAHSQLHFDKESRELEKEIRELEAESVAFVVMQHFNVDIQSEKYLALYKKTESLKDSLERIKSVSQDMIDFCESKLN